MRGLKKIVFSALMIGLLSACGGTTTALAPSAAPSAAPMAAATSGAAAATNTPVPATPTQAAVVATAVPPTVQPTVQPTAEPAAAVRIAVQLADNSVILVDQSGGKSLAFKASDPADLASISGIGNVLGDKLYLALSGRASSVVRIGANGPQTLDWIEGQSLRAAVLAVQRKRPSEAGETPAIPE